MLNDIYNTKILEYAGNIERIGRLENADASAKAHSKLCGSTIEVDLKMDMGNENGDGIVTDFAHQVKACALGQAAASIMARLVVGASASELKALKAQIYAMLKEEGEPPSGKFEEFKFLLAVRDYKARHASTLLTFDAVVDCIEQIEAEQIEPEKTEAEKIEVEQKSTTPKERA